MSLFKIIVKEVRLGYQIWPVIDKYVSDDKSSLLLNTLRLADRVQNLAHFSHWAKMSSRNLAVTSVVSYLFLLLPKLKD